MNIPHVLHLVISLDHGGLERQVLAWARERTHRLPESTTLMCLDRIGSLGDEAAGLPVLCVRSRRRSIPWDIAAVRRIRREIKIREKAGVQVVVHSHNLAAWQYGALAIRGTDARLIHTQHGANVHDYGWVNTIRVRLLLRKTDRLVTVSDETALEMATVFHLSPDRIDVVTNGIDIGLFDSASFREAGVKLRADMGIPPHALIVGSVGRLAHIKGQDRLIKAFASLCKMLPSNPPLDVRLLLVGDGPSRSELERQLLKLDVDADLVHFVGFQADPRPYLAGMDLFVLPSRSEGLPIALLEAMAMGVPVAVTAVGGNASVLGDVSGILLDVDEANWPGQLAKELERIHLGHPDLAGRVSTGRRRVEEMYSLGSSVDQYEALYTG